MRASELDTIRRVATTSLAIAMAIALSGCTPSMTITAEDRDILSCETDSPVVLTEITDASPSCDVAGQDLELPDGRMYEAPSIEVQVEWSRSNYQDVYAINLGSSGLVVAISEEDDTVTWLGNGEAIERYTEFFGDDYPGDVTYFGIFRY